MTQASSCGWPFLNNENRTGQPAISDAYGFTPHSEYLSRRGARARRSGCSGSLESR
jgi:hypothetical protein